MQYQLKDFNYNLPDNLIAQYPLKERTASRLMHLKNNNIAHYQFSDLLQLLRPNDLIIFNDTRVIPARLFATKTTGGKVEILIERVLDEHRALCHLKANRGVQIGQQLCLAAAQLEIVDFDQGLYIIKSATNLIDLINQHGHMPLPPYMDREDEQLDEIRYQTVYNKHQGAVAAPTAGLHFDDELMQALRNYGVDIEFITLHVGSGTFKPVKTENILDHKMHSEIINVSSDIAAKINAAKLAKRRIIAVGTTTLRSLETAGRSGECREFSGETDIFIYPGFDFKIVDCLITNFHVPKSTLLMLVAAFAGFDNIMLAYNIAISQQYRFFSYGDAMFLEKNGSTKL